MKNVCGISRNTYVLLNKSSQKKLMKNNERRTKKIISIIASAKGTSFLNQNTVDTR
jgi:hypothetical protein